MTRKKRAKRSTYIGVLETLFDSVGQREKELWKANFMRGQWLRLHGERFGSSWRVQGDGPVYESAMKDNGDDYVSISPKF